MVKNITELDFYIHVDKQVLKTVHSLIQSVTFRPGKLVTNDYFA